MKHNDGPPLSAWEAWSPEEAAEVLKGVACDWCVVGGWAIDLFLGQETRAHDDLEIAILRHDFSAMRDHLDQYILHAVGDGEIHRLEPGGITPEDKHQNWVLDPRENRWRMDVMLEHGDADTWIFRRDQSICAPRNEMVDRSGPISFLRPQGVLLFKAKAARDKDETDLANSLPRMSESERRWLRDALAKAHADHDWLKVL